MKLTLIPGLYEDKSGRYPKLFTKNLIPGISHFYEDLVKSPFGELRRFDERKSKLAAGIQKRIKGIKFNPEDKILYLGAAHGYTASYISDILPKSQIFALDFATTVVRKLVFVCQERYNMAPILANASIPGSYDFIVPIVDVIYQDIAQKNQAEILIKNSDRFLKKGGIAILAVKAKSIDMSKHPKKIYKMTERIVEPHFKIIDQKQLDPFEKDHQLMILKKK